jgi:hypothetical protein
MATIRLNIDAVLRLTKLFLSCRVSRTRLWWQLGDFFRKLHKPS